MAVRFCDKDVYCIHTNDMIRSKLLGFFLQNHLNDIVCVYNSEENLQGIITYKKLILESDAKNALQTEMVTFNESIFENARKCFKYNEDITLLPVLNVDGNLEYFCFNDEKANRVLRYMRCLLETQDCLFIQELYNNIECVNLYEMNEVSYNLYYLLQDKGIQANVYGEKWKIIEPANINCYEFSENAIMNIYAEGTDNWSKGQTDVRELLNSDITGQFDFIEQLYKVNYDAGRFEHYKQDWKILSEKLKHHSSPVILFGSHVYGEKVYNYLLMNEIYPVCFCGACRSDKYLDGIPVYTYAKCKEKYRDAIYMVANSADYLADRDIIEKLDYEGYTEGTYSYLLKDYVKDIKNTFLNKMIENKHVILTGSVSLCNRLFCLWKKENYVKKEDVSYCKMFDLEESGEISDKNQLNILEIEKCKEEYPEAVYFILERTRVLTMNATELKKIKRKLQKEGIKNVSTYFYHDADFLNYDINIPLSLERKQNKPVNHIRRLEIEDFEAIVIGFTKQRSGNVFIHSLLDGHPNILSLPCTYFQNALFLYSQQLTDVEQIEEIPIRLLDMYQQQLKSLDMGSSINSMFNNPSKFIQEFKAAINGRVSLTSKDIFVASFIAYFYMLERQYDFSADHLHPAVRPVIYVEPHGIRNKEMVNVYAGWAKKQFKYFTILRLVRDPLKSLGSRLRDTSLKNYYECSNITLWGMEEQMFSDFKEFICVIRFEDLKLFPDKVLSYLCGKFNIPWSENLMHSTSNGVSTSYKNESYEVNDFDLRPVYNEYNEYFSSFDIFRLRILYREFCKAYGYSYMDVKDFKKSQVIEWFQHPFKFEKLINFGTEDAKYDYKRESWKNNKRLLEMQEDMEHNKEWFEFFDYWKDESSN